MQTKDFIFAFTDREGTNPNFYALDASGNVVLTSNPYFLEFSPDGWYNISIQNVRNSRYFGLDRSVSIPFTYVEDAATILKHIAYNLGPEAKCYLNILQLTLDYNPGIDYMYWYKLRYKGEVDLVDFLHDGSKVTAKTLEDGITKHIKANENTDYELPMDVPDAKFIKMDGVLLKERANFSVIDGFAINQGEYGNNFIIGCVNTSNEGKSIGLQFETSNFENVQSLLFIEKLRGDNYIAVAYDNISTVDVRINGTIDFNISGPLLGSPILKFRFLTTNSTGATQDTYLIYTSPVVVTGNNYTFDFDITIPMPNGTRLYFENTNTGFIGGTITFTDKSKFNCTYKNKYKTTYIRSLPAQYIFSQLINKVSEGIYSPLDVDGITNYFGLNYHLNKVFTCGNAIRGFDDAVMKISLSNFFGFWDSFDSVGLNIKGKKIGINRKKKLIDFNNTISLGSVSNPKIRFYKDQFFNELEIGYPEIKNEIGLLNGKEEFNCLFNFSMGTTKSPKKLSKVTKIKTSPFEIEGIRITTVNKTTTDNKNDNDVYALHINNSAINGGPGIPVHYILDRTLNQYATGLLDAESVFNIEFSPKRNFIRNGDEIQSRCYKMNNKVLSFINADKNDKLTTTIPIGTSFNVIKEKAHVNISDLDAPYLLPIIIEFDYPSNFNLLDILELNALQAFDFDIDGTIYKGVIKQCGIDLSKLSAERFEVISAPTNDLTKLIKYHG